VENFLVLPMDELSGMLESANPSGRATLQQSGVNSKARAPLERLLQWGILERRQGDYRIAQGATSSDLQFFARFLEEHDPELRQLAVPDCPICFCTGLLNIPDPWAERTGRLEITIAAGGQGETRAQAALACLGEMVERVSLFSQGMGDDRVFEHSDELEDLEAGPFFGFSERQEKQLISEVRGLSRYAGENGLHWNRSSARRVRLTSFSDGTKAQFPSLGVLYGEQAVAGLAVAGLVSSSGSAVWRDVAGARQRAVRELVERDAFARSWYNRLGISRIPTEYWPAILSESLCRFLQSRSRTTGLFLVDCEFDTFVLAAISSEEDGLGGCLGVAAHSDVRSAAFSAVTEMIQGELSLQLARNAHSRTVEKSGAVWPPVLAYAETTRIFDDLNSEEMPSTGIEMLEREYGEDDLERSCILSGIDLWQFDATRPELGVPCIKILSSQLCSWQPRFGKPRLYAAGGHHCRDWSKLEQRYEERIFPF
jgi:ribosomal protein S12 methylthiotransferase accessory factor